MSIRVLLVDDEKDLCELVSVWLTDLGYYVRTEYNAIDALSVLDEERFDILFTDVVMPGMFDGIYLANTVHELYPWMEIYISSGHADGLFTTAGEIPGKFINKPYRKSEIQRLFSNK